MVVVTVHPNDPPVRTDGRCVVCRGERPDLAKRYLDPFCSNDCCRAYYDGCRALAYWAMRVRVA